MFSQFVSSPLREPRSSLAATAVGSHATLTGGCPPPLYPTLWPHGQSDSSWSSMNVSGTGDLQGGFWLGAAICQVAVGP